MQINSYSQQVIALPIAKLESSVFENQQKTNSVIEKARNRLQNYLQSIDPDFQDANLEYTAIDFRIYPDSSLGFYEPGRCYTFALVNGFEIQFKYGDQQYIVDTNGSRFVLRGTQVI